MTELPNTTIKQPKKTAVEPGERLVQRYVLALNTHASKKTASFFTEDFVMKQDHEGQIYGGQADMRQSLRALFALSPDFEIKIITISGAVNIWSMKWVWSGTFAKKVL